MLILLGIHANGMFASVYWHVRKQRDMQTTKILKDAHAHSYHYIIYTLYVVFVLQGLFECSLLKRKRQPWQHVEPTTVGSSRLDESVLGATCCPELLTWSLPKILPIPRDGAPASARTGPIASCIGTVAVFSPPTPPPGVPPLFIALYRKGVSLPCTKRVSLS